MFRTDDSMMSIKSTKSTRQREKAYVFELDYGARSREIPFITTLLAKFDRKSLVGIVLIVNNNPYSFEFYLYLNFAKRSGEFEKWLRTNYPDRARHYNLFVGDVIAASSKKRFNMVANPPDELFPLLLTPEGDGTLFLFPERNAIDYGAREQFKPDVFLSYSSKDRSLVDRVFESLQQREVTAWYDKYEIKAGDSISEKINDGLKRSGFGVLFLSSHYLDGHSGWPLAEMNYFFQNRMATKTPFLLFNVDLAHDELPPLLRDFKYIKNNKAASQSLLMLLSCTLGRLDWPPNQSAKRTTGSSPAVYCWDIK